MKKRLLAELAEAHTGIDRVSFERFTAPALERVVILGREEDEALCQFGVPPRHRAMTVPWAKLRVIDKITL